MIIAAEPETVECIIRDVQKETKNAIFFRGLYRAKLAQLMCAEKVIRQLCFGKCENSFVFSQTGLQDGRSRS